MAKTNSNDNGSGDEQLLASLRKALDGNVHLLQGKEALFPGGKKAAASVKKAKEEGLLEEKEPPPGQKATKTKRFVQITKKGRDYLREQDNPKKVLEAMLPVVNRLDERFQEVAAELQAFMTSQLGGLSKVLHDTKEMIAGILKKEPGETEQVAAKPEKTSKKGDESSAPPPTVGTDTLFDSVPLDELIRNTYEKMCHYVEYDDRLVVIPHLYHEVHEQMPDLKVEQFHNELLKLWNERQIELHVLNEVREAQEPEKAIHRNDRLYYWIMWK